MQRSRKGILLVDDETQALKYFSIAFGRRFPVYSASGAKSALEMLNQHQAEIGVIVTDQRMPETSGIDLLKTVRNLYPNTTRILTTAYSELDILIEAINVGAVHSFVSKPWIIDQLETTLLGALDHHENQIRNARLLQEKSDALKFRILEDRVYDVGLIAAKIGHYIHNALCPLTFLLDQLLDHNQNKRAYSVEFLQNVRKHIYEVARTLKDLEQASMPGARSAYQPVNLEESLDKALAETVIIRQQKELRIEKVVQGSLPEIKGIPSQIEKLFRFMIAEEIVSLPANNLLQVRFSEKTDERGVAGVNIEFEDFVPVSPQVCTDSLLYPFNLRGSNPRELGVFLVSCYFIARNHGGTLHARLKKDEGLSFSFFLPSDPEESMLQKAKRL